MTAEVKEMSEKIVEVKEGVIEEPDGVVVTELEGREIEISWTFTV